MRSGEPLFTWRNIWFSAGVGTVAGLAVLSLIAGFLVLPYATTDARSASVWDAICSAAGVPRATAPPTSAVAPSFKTSTVVMNATMPGPVDARSVGRGATLAMQCAICHASGRQSQPDTPNLEGQPAAAVYKQLRDFKSGARVNAVMSPFAVNLSEQDMVDIAAYYSYLPRQPGLHPAMVAEPAIVRRGAAMRNIPTCASCHGGGDFKLGAPWLEGQSAVYIKAQLQAFASNTRHNDITEQMRNIARRMTAQEIDEVAAYYASRP
ncbi:MAG: c-type cytochrome [Tardiphaga sp.]